MHCYYIIISCFQEYRCGTIETLKFSPPPPLTGIKRVNTVKILGVTLSDDLSVEDHVHAVISTAAQTLHALRLLRGHGMDDAALQTVFRAVVVSKLQYASCAWWGFSTVADKEKINSFIRRSARSGFVPADLPDLDDICRTADETLFCSIISKQAMYCFVYSRHNLPHLKTTISGVAFITCKY